MSAWIDAPAPDTRRLGGDWTLTSLPEPLAGFEAGLAAGLSGQDGAGVTWDLQAVGRMDSLGALVLLRAWGGKLPPRLQARPELIRILERAAAAPKALPPRAGRERSPLVLLGRLVIELFHNLGNLVALYGQFWLDLFYTLRHPQSAPWREFSATLFKGGAMALPVTAMVGFLIGVTISYLSALQLKAFGADLFIVNILGISIIRELGPVLVAVLVAGRSGSAMTAQIGVMRVTEEIDALVTMGISRTHRLVLPRLLALTVAMPLLVLWTSTMALIGGMLSAWLQLDLSLAYFAQSLPRAVPVANLWIGLAKGAVFGFLIALIACHFGLHVKPNTESLSARTTNSVVSAITIVILADAVFAIVTRSMGMPG